jgi:two-component system, sensor histidine kinase and response regulator
MSSARPVTGSILITDDDPSMRMMLRRVLHRDGFTVWEAEDGIQALKFCATHHAPDIMLVDAMMPNLDGFGLCEELQRLGIKTSILIITGLDDEESVDRAFKVGAIDYVTKPIHWPVLRQRVKRIMQAKELEQMKDDLTTMIVHDMKNPLSTIRGYAELMLQDRNPDAWNLESVSRIYHNSVKLLNMTMMILDIGRLEEGKMPLQPSQRPVMDALVETQQAFEWMATDHDVHLAVHADDPAVAAILDWNLITRVIGNLVSNAIKHSKVGSTVIITAGTNEECLLLSVIDQGEGISEEDQKMIWNRFTQAKLRRSGTLLDTGLGLTFCKLAVETHGGRIDLKSELGYGSQFTLVLPGVLVPQAEQQA